MGTNTDDADVDPEELRRELTQIKEAVGLKDRYESAVELWVVIGMIVAVASAASQYVYTRGLSGWFYAAIWIGFVGGGTTLYSYWRGGSNPFRSRGDRPNVNLILAVLYLGAFPILTVAGYYLDGLGQREESLLSLSVIVLMLGLGYVVVGQVLKAYYVRDRDRYPFYVGGIGMVGLALAMPAFEALRDWPYVAFGGGYLVYALATYAYLGRPTE